MTAVAPPVTFQNINRQAWAAEGVPNGGGALFMPRKSAQRTNSSSSLSSQASITSTISASSSQFTAATSPNSGESPAWAARKTKAPKGLWPASKTEPIAGLSSARTQPGASAGATSSGVSAMNTLQSPSAMVPPQLNGGVQPSQQNGMSRIQLQEGTAFLHLVPINGTFERKTITVPFFPEVLKIGRQTNNKTIPSPVNGYFDSKVLSRSHAEVWADRNGKIWIRDVKSSNGTFVNGARLSQEARDSDPHELREQDRLELGIDIVSEDQKTVVHHKVAACVEHAGIYTRANGEMMDLNFGDLDGSQLSNIMGPGGQQQLANMRGRTPSHGAINSQRLQGPMPAYGNGLPQQRHANFWLQPITMEQVVKKLNVEIKAAKQQSQELQQTHQFINSVLAADPKKESIKGSPISNVRFSPIKENHMKTRFTDPPAPPPQHPLPEKPDVANSLKKSDAERPKSSHSTRSDAQISVLDDALTCARKEIESQGIRLRDLETLLSEERRAREDAEERAKQLEWESIKDQEQTDLLLLNGSIHHVENAASKREKNSRLKNGAASSNGSEYITIRLQQRLESMISEMNEMKQQVERYRVRAEAAEADRKSLAEMIENIRKENVKTTSRETDRQGPNEDQVVGQKIDSSVDGSEEDRGEEFDEGEITIIREKDLNETETFSKGSGNGHTAEHIAPQQTLKISNALAIRRSDRDPMYYGGPVGAMVTVVAIGVAVMAMLNQYPRAER